MSIRRPEVVGMRRPYIFRLEENKALVRKGIEALGRRDLTALDELVASDYVDHTNELRGRDAVKRVCTRILKDSPDFTMTVEDIIAEHDKVWVRLRLAGTAAAGKHFELASVTILRLADGKVAEGWAVPKLVSKEKTLNTA